MKKFIVLLCAVAFIVCNSQQPVEAIAEAKTMIPADTHGFTPLYSAFFAIDSAKNTESVLGLWSSWKNWHLSTARQYFAASVTFFMQDGSGMMGQSDTIMKGMQAYRNSFTKMDVSVDAVFAVKSTDKNEHRVTIWGSEIRTGMKGITDTVSEQETWPFNDAGKVVLMFQV